MAQILTLTVKAVPQSDAQTKFIKNTHFASGFTNKISLYQI